MDAAGQPFFVAFAEEVDRGENAAGRLGVLLLGAHAGEQPAVADPDLDLAADLPGQRDRGIGVPATFGQALQIERDLAARSGDLEHDADRLARIVDCRLRWPTGNVLAAQAGAPARNSCLLMSDIDRQFLLA